MLSSPLSMRIPFRVWGTGILIVALVIVLIVIMSQIWPVGSDYFYHYHAAAVRYVNGETRLYDVTDLVFFNAPWTLLLLVPLSQLPLQLGEAILNVLSLAGMIACVSIAYRSQRIPLYGLLLSFANLYTVDLFVRGQLDAFPLMGILLGWWAIRQRRPIWLSVAFLLLAIKPLNVILVALIFLFAIRGWPRSHQLRALSLPLLLTFLSGLAIGFDWPFRYMSYVVTMRTLGFPADGLSSSLWRGVDQLDLPTWPLSIFSVIAVAALGRRTLRDGLTEQTLCSAISANLLFSTYANDSHYVLLIPAFLFVARRDWKLTLLAYVSTWMPLVRLAWGYSAAPLDVFYPALLFFTIWLLDGDESRIEKPEDDVVIESGSGKSSIA